MVTSEGMLAVAFGGAMPKPSVRFIVVVSESRYSSLFVQGRTRKERESKRNDTFCRAKARKKVLYNLSLSSTPMYCIQQ